MGKQPTTPPTAQELTDQARTATREMREAKRDLEQATRAARQAVREITNQELAAYAARVLAEQIDRMQHVLRDAQQQAEARVERRFAAKVEEVARRVNGVMGAGPTTLEELMTMDALIHRLVNELDGAKPNEALGFALDLEGRTHLVWPPPPKGA